MAETGKVQLIDGFLLLRRKRRNMRNRFEMKRKKKMSEEKKAEETYYSTRKGFISLSKLWKRIQEDGIKNIIL